MPTISFRIDSELESAVKGMAKIENKSVSTFIVDLIKERLEDEDDYKLAMAAYDTIDLNDNTTLEDLCKEAGIDYDEL